MRPRIRIAIKIGVLRVDICFWFYNTDLILTHTGGGPPWPKYTAAKGETMILDDKCEVKSDPDRAARKALPAITWQPRPATRLHLMETSILAEVLKDGHLVATALHSFAMPIIRYSPS